VSVLFIDIVGSTELAERLDPEPLRQILDRYFATCTAVITEQGGMVEKFIGDAVMAAFGVTYVREDDAVRAVRAAAGVLAGLRRLSAELAASYNVSLEARCGICSGNVMVIAAPGGDFRVVGDAVNTASRLQTAARPGEILIGADTAALVRAQVSLEPVPPLSLKGKTALVPAWRVTDATRSRDDDDEVPPTAFIGRADELAELGRGLARVAQRGQPGLITVLGTPGIGKSRLVREFMATLAAGEATVLSARCPPNGRGLTYTPLAELLHSYPGGREALDRSLSADPDLGARAAGILRPLFHVPPPAASETPDPAAEVGVEEIAWAVRHLLEQLARTRPVVMVWEDLHWAAPTLLDLIDDIVTWLPDTPVLLLCVARTELLETRPSWGGGKLGATSIELGPLSEDQSAALVSELCARWDVVGHADDDLSERIVRQCDGNPLFVELMLDVFAEVAPATVVPPTIHALLGARLDQLPADERQVLEMAAVTGREFIGAELRDLARADQMDGARANTLIARLVRRRILRRAGVDSFRFDQSLMRDTTYTFTSKVRRERYHLLLAERFAPEAAAAAAAASVDDSMAFAYHTEAAWLLRRELRPGAPGLPALASVAADVLIAEGNRALARKDLPGAIALLERGRDLLPTEDARHTTVALRICDAAIALWDESASRSALSAAETALPGNGRNAVTCAIQRQIVDLRLGFDRPESIAARALLTSATLAGDPGDDLGWCRQHQLDAYLHLAVERAGAADQALRLALGRARAMEDTYEEDRLLCAICEVAQWAPVHVRTGLDLCDRLTSRFAANRALQVPILVTRARLSAMAGDLDAARQALAAASAYSGALHLDLADAVVLEQSGFVESLAGDHGRAVECYQQGLEILLAAPEQPGAQTLQVAIARELLSQRQLSAATAAIEHIGAKDGSLGPGTRVAMSSLRARIASARGDHGGALRHAEDARELVGRVDDLCMAGEPFFDLAMVQRAAGLGDQAAASAALALDSYDAKGATLLATRVRTWLGSAAGQGGG